MKEALDKNKYVLERVTGKDVNGKPVFAYVLLRKKRLADFRREMGRRDVDLAEFGVIVAYGSGTNPPADFEQHVLEAVRKL